MFFLQRATLAFHLQGCERGVEIYYSKAHTSVFPAAGHGQDDGAGPRADRYLPGPVGDGDQEPQRRGV